MIKIMINKLKQISLGNWILIGMILGLIFGLILNFGVQDPFIKNVIFMNNIFYLGRNLFIKLMKMLVVPLVFCSIVVGVASISDIKTLGSIGGTTIIIYLITTAIAVTLALLIGILMKPGLGLNMVHVAQTANVTVNQTMADTLLNMVPDNPFNSLANGDMLPVIIFGLLTGIILAKLKDETKIFNEIFTEGNNYDGNDFYCNEIRTYRSIFSYGPNLWRLGNRRNITLIKIFCLRTRRISNTSLCSISNITCIIHMIKSD